MTPRSHSSKRGKKKWRETLSSELATTDDGEATLVAQSRWHSSRPSAPSSFPDLDGLKLQQKEAEYLRERILTAAPNSLLAAVLREEIEGASFPWTIAANASLSAGVTAHVELAKHFSESMHGAALIYNLMLARETHNDARVEEYETKLGRWSGLVEDQADVFVGWDSNTLWDAAASAGRGTRQFVESWHGLVVSRIPAQLGTSPFRQPSS